MKILITGGNGYIARSIYAEMLKIHDVSLITRKDLDLLNTQKVVEWFSDKTFDVVIHCAVSGGSRLKQDTYEVMDSNLLMYYNLLQCQPKYTKFIHFGSGAEIYNRDTPYGLSKYVIEQSMSEKNSFYNLRIFAVFDENELDSRFIKSNIIRYINGESIEIHQDKYMDFIYMPDLIAIVEKYISTNEMPKQTDCVYNKTCSLSRIAQIINDLDSHKVEILMGEGYAKNYMGSGNSLMMDFIGLENGIKEVYKKLKNDK